VQNALGKHLDALDNINKALTIEEELKDSSAIASCVGNIGTIYFTLQQYEKALEYYERGLALTSNSENTLGEGINHCNIGEVYYLIAIDSNTSSLQKLFDGNKAVALVQAEKNLEQAEAIFKTMGISNGLTEVYDYMSRIKLEQGNYKNALHLFKLHIAYRDSVFNEEDKAQIARIEKDRSEDIKQKEIEIQKLQLEKVQNERLYFVGGIILLLLLSGVLYNRFRLREKSNEKIQAAYDNLKQTQQQLIQSEKMASLGQLSVGIAHEIQNPLNFVKNFSELSEELVDEFTTVKTDKEREEIGKYLKLNLGKITEHGNRVGSIIKGMLLSLQTATGEKVPTDVNKLCAEYTDIAYKTIAGNNMGFKCKVDKMLDPQLPRVTVVPQDISRVVLNLAKNAFTAISQKQKSNTAKTGWQPTVTIATRFMSSTERNKQGALEIIIRDNGAGIPDNIQQKIFEPFFTTYGQQGATGLGLSVCYDIVKTYWGDITVESKENEFTKFVVSIPV
jgi:signal transduction histidine kinase